MKNIAEIVKDMPQGTKLWTPICGEVVLLDIGLSGLYPIVVRDSSLMKYSFTKKGTYYEQKGAEMLLFPSKEMRDWSKVFKEGDVLENTSDNVFPRYVLFEKFIDDKYTTFEAITRIIVGSETVKSIIQDTLSYSKVEDEDKALEIKKKILKIVAKKAESSPTLQPFDKVLVRDWNTEFWRPAFFGLKRDKEGGSFTYITSCGMSKYCIPYNEETKHLLGTTDPYEL